MKFRFLICLLLLSAWASLNALAAGNNARQTAAHAGTQVREAKTGGQQGAWLDPQDILPNAAVTSSSASGNACLQFQKLQLSHLEYSAAAQFAHHFSNKGGALLVSAKRLRLLFPKHCFL